MNKFDITILSPFQLKYLRYRVSKEIIERHDKNFKAIGCDNISTEKQISLKQLWIDSEYQKFDHNGLVLSERKLYLRLQKIENENKIVNASCNNKISTTRIDRSLRRRRQRELKNSFA